MKRNGTRRLYAALLALIMVLVLLPVGAAKAADEGSLKVGGTYIDLSQNGSYCDGKIVFEIIDGKNVLTLNDYKLENYNGNGISADGIDLTIVGSAEIGVTDASAIFVHEGNLTLNGDFTLRAQNVTGPALSVDGDLTVEGGALDVENTYEGNRAISIPGAMTVNGGTVHAKANGTYAIAASSITLNNDEAYLLGDANASEVKIGVAEYPLWVGGVQVTSANQRDIFGDGTAKFEVTDEGENVLTLNNYKLENYNDDDGIYADGIDLTIVGSAEIGVTDASAISVGDGDLTLNGDFTLRADSSSPLFIVRGNLIVAGGTLDAESTFYAAEEGGYHAIRIDSSVQVTGMTVNGGTVHAKAVGTIAIYTGSITLNNDEAFLLGDVYASEVFIGKEYPLWVGGEQINDLNKGDIFGDGTAKFEIIDGENVLTLNGYKLENYNSSGIYADGIDLTIVGSAEIGVTGATAHAIAVNGNLTLNGDFTLRAQSQTGAAVVVVGNLTVEGGALDVENTYEGNGAIGIPGTMTVNGGTVHAKANGTNAIYARIILNNGEQYLLGDAYASEVFIGKEYPLYVGGEQVNDLNKGDIFGDGTAKFEIIDGENVLTLNNANVTACGTFDGNTACIYYGRVATGLYHDSLTLCLIGENTLYDAADYGIKTAGSSGSMYQETNDLVITGEGSLTADCVKDGLSVHGTIDVSGVTVTARGNADYGIYSFGDITITGSTITAEAEKSGIFTPHKLTIGGESYVIADSAGSNAYEAVYAMDGIVLNDGMAVADPANGYVQDGSIYQTDGTKAKHVVIGKAYPLWVGTVQVNVFNKDDILNDGGTAKFEITDEGENVLTLSNWKLENFVYTGIRAEGIDLTINGSAEIGVNGENAFAIYVEEGDLTLDGNFTLRANTLYNTTLAVTGYLTVEGGALDVENIAEGRFTIIVLRGMTVNGGTVHAKANGARAIVTPRGITLNNGEQYLLGDADASEVKIGVPVEYTITFVNEDGTELQSGEVLLGETPAYTGKEPTKHATAQYTYTFAGWKDENGIVYGLTDDLPAVTGEMTYTAIYTSTVNEYTITFVNEDGTVLQEELIAYGETPAYNGETPTKEKTLRFEYTFAGWDPEIVPVTGEATYTAVFTESLLHPIFICGDADALDVVVKEGDETLYRYDVTVTDLLDGAVDANSAQIFLTYDHDKLELKRGEGPVDWTLNDAGDMLSAAWASDSTTTLKNGDVVLTLYFAAKNIVPGEAVAIGFAQNDLGLGSALSFVSEGETTEFFANTQDGSITFAAPERFTIAGEDVLSGDVYAIEDGRILYRYDIRVQDLPEAGLWINSAQIFAEFDHAVLAAAKTEGKLDWTVSENGDKLMAVWASDEEVQLEEDDVVLTLWFEKIGPAPEDGRVPVTFTTNLMGNASAASIAFFGTVLELEADTVDGSVTFEEVLLGDANCDGVITSADAALILRAMVGLSELSMRGVLNADVDGDLEVTAADAATILRYIVGLIDAFPVEEP